jgi:hypothetical protein
VLDFILYVGGTIFITMYGLTPILVFSQYKFPVILRFPEVTEVAHLVDITERIIENYLSSKVAVALPKGRELEMIEQLLNKELGELIAKGYVKDNVKNNLRSLTIKGAYLMIWKILWPVKQIREYKDLAFSKKILSEVQY